MSDSMLELIVDEAERQNRIKVERVRTLGKGRGGITELLRKDDGTLIAEKKQDAGLLTQLIYCSSFQKGYAYKSNEDAIRAAFYRRKVVRVFSGSWYGKPRVADAFYTRYDNSTNSFCLGTEFIEGRGPIPNKADTKIFHRLFGLKHQKPEHYEIKDLIEFMEDFRLRLHESGFIGSEWQVDKSVLVPTANFLRDKDRDWMCVDLESGVPALTRPYYLRQGILFDDIAFETLHKYFAENRQDMARVLGDEACATLELDVEKLEYHTKRWKNSEPALFRHGVGLFTDREKYTRFKESYISQWIRERRISAYESEKLRSSELRFLCYYFKNAAAACGEDIQRLAGLIKSNRIYRFFTDKNYFKNSLRYAQKLTGQPEERTRLAEGWLRTRLDGLLERGWISKEEYKADLYVLQKGEIQEDLSHFGAHLALKAVPFVGPITRTIYTSWQIVKDLIVNGRIDGYKFFALVLGAVPKVGGFLAYPFAIAFREPCLGASLDRIVESEIGQHIPIYGGKNTRTESAIVKAGDFKTSSVFAIKDLVRYLWNAIWNKKSNPYAAHASQMLLDELTSTYYDRLKGGGIKEDICCDILDKSKRVLREGNQFFYVPLLGDRVELALKEKARYDLSIKKVHPGLEVELMPSLAFGMPDSYLLDPERKEDDAAIILDKILLEMPRRIDLWGFKVKNSECYGEMEKKGFGASRVKMEECPLIKEGEAMVKRYSIGDKGVYLELRFEKAGNRLFLSAESIAERARIRAYEVPEVIEMQKAAIRRIYFDSRKLKEKFGGTYDIVADFALNYSSDLLMIPTLYFSINQQFYPLAASAGAWFMSSILKEESDRKNFYGKLPTEELNRIIPTLLFYLGYINQMADPFTTSANIILNAGMAFAAFNANCKIRMERKKYKELVYDLGIKAGTAKTPYDMQEQLVQNPVRSIQ